MINDNKTQEREQQELKRNMDLLDTADAQEHIKLRKPRNTVEVKE